MADVASLKEVVHLLDELCKDCAIALFFFQLLAICLMGITIIYIDI